MRNTVRAALAALSLTTVALIASPAAQAFTDGTVGNHYGGGSLGDQNGEAYATQLNVDQSILRATKDNYFDAAKATDYGQAVCRGLTLGNTEDQIVNRAVASNIPADMFRAVVHGAEFHFCPNYFRGKEV